MTAAPAEGGTLEDTFEWNKRAALSNLLMMEEHYKDLSEDDVPHAWCIVKHYLLALDHHVEEAIGHAERLGKDPTPFREFRSKLMKLDSFPKPNFQLPELLALRTEWRQVIEDPTLVPDCPTCSADVTPGLLEEMRADAAQAHTPLGADLLKLEAKYTTDVLKKTAKAFGVPPPHFKIVDCGEKVDPSGRAIATVGDNGEPFMAVCAGGVNSHTLLHEFDHIQKHNQGNCDLKLGNCPEDAAETFALMELSNSMVLNTHPVGGGSGSKHMAMKKYEILGIYGASLTAKVVEKAVENMDATTPAVIPGQPWSTPSNVVYLLGGVGIPVAQLMTKKNLLGKYEVPAIVFAAHLASQLVEDAIAMIPGLNGGTASRVAARRYVPARTVTPRAPTNVSVF